MSKKTFTRFRARMSLFTFLVISFLLIFVFTISKMDGESKISDKEIEVLTDENSRIFDKERQPSETDNTENEAQTKDSSMEPEQETSFNSEETQDRTRTGNASDAGARDVPQGESKEEAIGVIENYVKGTPLEGNGHHIYEASAVYEVDYLSTVAIARLESPRGEFCVLPYNAWG